MQEIPPISIEAPGCQPAEVARVICSSVSLVQGSVMDALFKFRNRLCVSANDSPLRSAILYSSGHFVWWVEGPGPEVRQALLRAALDRRNEGQAVIHRSWGAASLAEPLNVVTTQGADTPRAFGRRIRQLKADLESGIAMAPAAVWQRLIAPCTVVSGRAHTHWPDRHVALVSAEDNGPIDLLRKLGERHGAPVVYQRVAGGQRHSSDLGLAYVDLPVAGQVTRIHLLSRRALTHRIVRLSLDGLDELVMLMGTRPAAAIDLASSVADCVNALAAPPAILQVTDREEIAATVGRLLQRSGTALEDLRVTRLPETQLENFLLDRELLAGPVRLAEFA